MLAQAVAVVGSVQLHPMCAQPTPATHIQIDAQNCTFSTALFSSVQFKDLLRTVATVLPSFFDHYIQSSRITIVCWAVRYDLTPTLQTYGPCGTTTSCAHLTPATHILFQRLESLGGAWPCCTYFRIKDRERRPQRDWPAAAGPLSP